MLNELQQQLLQAKDELGQYTSSKNELVPTREALAQKSAQCRLLETHLDMIQSDLNKLEGIGLLNLLCSFFGNKEQRRDNCREKIRQIQKEYDQCRAELAETQDRLSALERQVEQGCGREAEYKALLEEKKQQILLSQSVEAEKLTALSADLGAARERLGCLERAVDAGESLLRTLRNTKQSLNKIGKKHLSFGQTGAVVYKPFAMLVERETTPMLSGLGSALMRFKNKLAELDFEDQPQVQELLAGLNAQIEETCPQVGELGGLSGYDCAAANIMEEQICSMAAILEERLETAQEEVKQLSDAKERFVEECE